LLAAFRRRLTYANVVATLALFAALGGGAWAAFTLPAGSVGTRQLKNRAVTPAKLAPTTVRRLRGKRGPAGPSDIFVQGVADGPIPEGSFVQVASLTLPPGHYLLRASGGFYNTVTGTAATVSCQLSDPAHVDNQWDYETVTLPATQSATSSEIVSLAGADTFTKQQRVALLCSAGGDGTMGATPSVHDVDVRLWAVKTGALHGARPPVD
jgi:hypothetical protein